MHIRTIWWVNRRAEWGSLFICSNLRTHSPVNSISTLSKVCLCVSQDHAYPADELMPLTCRGRVRGLEPSRGDIDDALGKWVAGCLCYDHSSPRRFTYLTALEVLSVCVTLDKLLRFPPERFSLTLIDTLDTLVVSRLCLHLMFICLMKNSKWIRITGCVEQMIPYAVLLNN